MNEIPFKYGKPVTAPYFIDRESELEELYHDCSKVTAGGEINIALLGLRRTGKTSLLRNLIDNLKDDKKIVPVFMDCYGIPSRSTFGKQMGELIKDAYIEKTKDMGYKERIKSLVKKKTSDLLSRTSEMEISIANYLSIRIGLQEGGIDVWERSLEYAENIGKEKDVYFVMILDEFPDIAIRWGDDFVKRFRAVVQHQSRCMYIIAGSAVTYMTELVHSEGSPFYRQLKTVKLEKLPEDITRSFVGERLDMEEDAMDRFIDLTGGFPDYTQRLGYILFRRYGKEDLSLERLERGYEEMLDELQIEFKETLSRFNMKSGTYGDIILSLAYHKRASDVARDVNMPLSALPGYMDYLMRVGMVEKEKRGIYRLSDPVFNEWVKRMQVIPYD